MVHEFKEGKDDLSQQHEMFRGRTAVFADQVVVGNASLRLKNVQLMDAGTYTCYIRTSKGKGNANLEYKTGGESLLKGGGTLKDVWEYLRTRVVDKNIMVCS